MLFNSIEYIVFLVVVFFIWWALAKKSSLRVIFLLIASYYFYMSWNAVLIFLIVFSTLIDYFCGAQIEQAKTKKKKQLFLIISLAANLGLLGFFKYTNFFIGSFNGLNTMAGTNFMMPVMFGLLFAFAINTFAKELMQRFEKMVLRRIVLAVSVLLNIGIVLLADKFNLFFAHQMVIRQMDIILPVGISFYTFQSMSYTIDIYRGELKPIKSFLKFALFVSFFPQLVAGPIVRARDFLPQLEKEPVIDAKSASWGFYLIIIGLIKKVVIADYLAVNLVDRVFENPVYYSPLEALFGVYSYAMQIYCDFSGYSDMAIGSALLLGFKLPENFNVPYVAVNLQDFWHRWHISLSTWLRDYLYIPLGGSRKGPARTYLNVFITFFLGGLWHGAGWTFVVWGLMHGIGLAVTRMVQRFMKVRKIELPQKGFWHIVVYIIGVFFTFHYVCISWIFFRGSSFKNAWEVFSKIGQMFKVKEGITIFQHIADVFRSSPNITPTILILLAIGFGAHFAPRQWIIKVGDAFSKLPAFAQALILVAVGVLLYKMATTQVTPFIYFQF